MSSFGFPTKASRDRNALLRKNNEEKIPEHHPHGLFSLNAPPPASPSKKRSGGRSGPSSSSSSSSASVSHPQPPATTAPSTRYAHEGHEPPSNSTSYAPILTASPRKAQLRLPMLRSVMMPSDPALSQAEFSRTISEPYGAVSASSSTSSSSSSSMSASSGVESGSLLEMFAKHNVDPSQLEHTLQLKTGEEAIAFFARHGNSTAVKFVYCNRAPPRNEVDYRPFDLEVVSRAKLNADEYFTISSTGVVHVIANQPSEFTSLADWMHQSTCFNVLRKIRYFKHYLEAKMFRLWRSNVRYRLYCKQRQQITRNLFFARPSFCESLIQVNKSMYEMEKVEMCQFRSDHVMQVEAFIKEQSELRNQAGKALEATMENVHSLVEHVCKSVKERARAFDHGIAEDEMSNSRFAQHLLGGQGKLKPMHVIKSERAERIRLAKHAALEASMLGDFIRLVDYIQVERLVGKAIQTSGRLLEDLHNQRRAFFWTTVYFGSQSLVFQPTNSDMHRIVTQMLDGMISILDHVERVKDMPKFKPFVNPQIADFSKTDEIIRHDKAFQEAKRGIESKLDEDFAQAERLVSFLEKHRPVYAFGQAWNTAAYQARTDPPHTVETLQNDMAQQTKWALAIKRIRDVYEAGIFQVVTRKLKMGLLPVTHKALTGMKELLLRMFHTQCSSLYANYTDKLKMLDQDPLTLPAFAAHVETFNAIKEEGKVMLERSKKIQTMHELLVDHEVKIASADAVLYDDLLVVVQSFQQQLQATDQKIKDKMTAMRATVYKNISRLNSELEQQKQWLDEGIFVDDKSVPKDVLKALDQVKATLSEISQQTKTLQGYQVLFQTEPYPFHSLPEAQALYEKKRAFWQLYADWIDKTNAWNKDDFQSLDVEQMNEDVKTFYNAVFQITKEQRSSSVATKLKTLVQEYRALMPPIMELGHKAMRGSHWRLLLGQLGLTSSFAPGEKIKLKKLRALKLLDRRQEITDIFEQAVEEFSLESGLEKIKAHWSKQCFNVVNYQRGLIHASSAPSASSSSSASSSGTYVLGDIEDIVNKLEEHQAQLQSMLASRYASAVQASVEMWDAKLGHLSETLEEWMTVQRNWVQLEPIFAAPDIQRQLPSEHKLFAEVDRFWRTLMRGLQAQPNALDAVRPATLPAALARATKDLERIQKQLEEYLETKRLAFPRFYFLSNEELLAILAQAQEPQAVQPHLGKCFDNIHRLIFRASRSTSRRAKSARPSASAASASSATPTSPTTTEAESLASLDASQADVYEVVAMVSGEGECVPMARPVLATGSTELWLAEVEQVMRLSVKQRIHRALLSYPHHASGSGNGERERWLWQFPAQAVLTVDQIVWTAGATEAMLASSTDRHAMTAFLELCKAQIASAVNLIVNGIPTTEEKEAAADESDKGKSVSSSWTLLERRRQLLSSLIILDVHARDIVSQLISSSSSASFDPSSDFQWLKQMRYYWANTMMAESAGQQDVSQAWRQSKDTDNMLPPEEEDVLVRQSQASFHYRHEYLGVSTRLVMTPLTDKAYLTLTNALLMTYGGAPAGPAGTGKTETVKDLAKALAVQIVVFNCSEGLKAKLMGQYFSGLAQSGAWACFDEFNRIDVEVLSVIAQQVMVLQQALAMEKDTFEFEGRTLRMDRNFGIFITMNPGYAGRSELPDNLKALFRPVAMMVPDYALIAQIILFSEGFQNATVLSKKMVQLYKLASEQLSKQDHYDFGMRAVKSVLVMAGTLKRQQQQQKQSGNEQEQEVSEDLVLIRALRDSNLPKFLSRDIPLFEGILMDLFPQLRPSSSSSSSSTDSLRDHSLLSAIQSQLASSSLQQPPAFVHKIVQLYQTLRVRHGVMVVGAPMTGKTTLASVLSQALNNLAHAPSSAADFREVQRHVLNPKSVSLGELYGQVQPITMEWRDGLVASLVRTAVEDKGQGHKWLTFDGPVDALWVENLNTVLDDSQLLCLNNGERIKLTPQIRILFEVQDLKEASPATVSRCGMVYLEPVHLGWEPLLDSWRPHIASSSSVTSYHHHRLSMDEKEKDDESSKTTAIDISTHQHHDHNAHEQPWKTWIVTQLRAAIPGLLTFIREKGKQMIPAVENALVLNCLHLFESFFSSTLRLQGREVDDVDVRNDEDRALLAKLLWQSVVWSFGANLCDESRRLFSDFLYASDMAKLVSQLPIEMPIYDYMVDPNSLSFVPWSDKAPSFQYDITVPYFNLLVPTSETVRYSYLLHALVSSGKHVWLSGHSGTGKTVVVQDYLRHVVSGGNGNAAPFLLASGHGQGSNANAEDGETSHSAASHHSSTSEYVSMHMMFSARTSSQSVQDVMESKLEKKRKNWLGAPAQKKMLVFVDDINMPQKEVYGAQPPLELLRQTLDQGGFYDRKKLFFKRVSDVVMIAASGAPGGGRNVVSSRLTRHFHLLWQPELSDHSLHTIFTSILGGFLLVNTSHWAPQSFTALDAGSGSGPVHLASRLVQTSIDLYSALRRRLLPTPAKSHYTFNLRDLSRVVQGMTQLHRSQLREEEDGVTGAGVASLLRLWCHESARVFRDRLVDQADRQWFNTVCLDKLQSSFPQAYSLLLEQEKKKLGESSSENTDPKASLMDTMYGDFVVSNVGSGNENDRLYAELANPQVLTQTLLDQLTEYNLMYPNAMHLVFFRDAIQHLTRIARILRQPRGNALLVGLGGSGRQSLTRLAAFMAGYKCQTVEVGRAFSMEDWRTSVKKVLEIAGVENQPVVFLLNDQQLVHEAMLEDLNQLLNAGEVPGCYEQEEVEALVNKVRLAAKAAGKSEARDSVMQHFVQTVRENLHIVLCFSPIGDSFRVRCRRYPALSSCCTIDWYNEWPAEALYSVADRFLSEPKLELESYKEALCRMCVTIHSSVTASSHQFYEQYHRHNYTTPASYLELLRLYIQMLLEQRKRVTDKIVKYRHGLSRLQSARKRVAELKNELLQLQPILVRASEETQALMVDLQKDQVEAKETAAVCAQDAQQCAQTTAQVQSIKDECEASLNEALPAYEAAVKSLSVIKKEHITVLKSFQHPPKPVQKVMEAVCILFKIDNPSWEDAKRLLGKVRFLEMCIDFDKDHIQKSTLKRLRPYLDDPEFVPEKLESVSQAAVFLCLWVRAMDEYARVFALVAPKKKALEVAEAGLAEAEETLASKQMSLRVVEARVAALQAKYRAKQAEKQHLEKSMQNTQTQLSRAERLVGGLGTEEIRWAESADQLNSSLKNLVGNVLLAAGCVSYIGPFTADFRAELLDEWTRGCHQCQLPVDQPFSLVKVLGDPLTLRKWFACSLPADDHSQVNGVLVTRSRRWPLMIDPQLQANRWLKQLMKKEKRTLQAIKVSDPNYLRTFEHALRYGQSILLEDVGETLEPTLEPVLTRQTFRKGGQTLVRLNDNEVVFHPDFRLYLTSKLANPHYLPDVFVKVTIINFTVTTKGLEDQLLVDVCRLERPDLEQRTNTLTQSIAADRDQLAALEDKVLDMLADSKGNILEDEVLIDALSSSQNTAHSIETNLEENEKIMSDIRVVREEYRVVATRGSLLYAVVAELSRLQPMYQYSLQYFNALYQQRIAQSGKSDDLSERLKILVEDLTHHFYVDICRGLFESHRLLFSLLMTVTIECHAGRVSEAEWNFWLRGPATSSSSISPLPWLSNRAWQVLSQPLPQLASLASQVTSQEDGNPWKQWVQGPDTTGEQMPAPWPQQLTAFQHLLVISLLKPEKTTVAAKQYISQRLDSSFIQPPPLDMRQVFASSRPNLPIIFILSPGANPMSSLLKLAKERGMSERFHHVSLGEGQGPIAEKLMTYSRREGDWLCLQNCHLSASWLPTLEKLLDAQQSSEPQGSGGANNEGAPHENYRLFLTSMPSDVFPISILQNAIKVTNEPPAGLANNLMRTYLDLTEEEYGDQESSEDSKSAESSPRSSAAVSSNPSQWVFKRLLFGLAWFHAVVQERRKFGPIGWNIPYEWMNSDFEVSKRQLRQYLNLSSSSSIATREQAMSQVPWATLQELIGDVNYAGRVTDDKDQRCVQSLLLQSLNPDLLSNEYTFANLPQYSMPPDGDLASIRSFIQQLPSEDSPELFGLHPNADITFHLQEARNLTDTLVSLQPRTLKDSSSAVDAAAAVTVEQTDDEIVANVTSGLEARLPEQIAIAQAHPNALYDASLPSADSDSKTMSPLGVFLLQEIERINILLSVVKDSLFDLRQALSGLVLMSPELEQTHSSLLLQRVPKQWSRVAYPSTKALGPWFDDLCRRVEHLRQWLTSSAPPTSFWLPGYFFPQGFMTALLQTHARKADVPIDCLRFETEVCKPTPSGQEVQAPQDGAFISGLYLQGAGWDNERSILIESQPTTLFVPMPLIHLRPVVMDGQDSNPSRSSSGETNAAYSYECPLYKTSLRAGELSTTGHSTNFVLYLHLRSMKPSEHWVRRGCALLCQLDS